MSSFITIVYSPPGSDDPALAIAASRAGALGVFDATAHDDPAEVDTALNRLAQYAHNPYGIRLAELSDALMARLEPHLGHGLNWVILDLSTAQELGSGLAALRGAGARVLVELTATPPDCSAEGLGVDGWIAKGREAGGLVGTESTMELLFELLDRQAAPVYAYGGIGLHSAAGCYAAGASGVVLDSQMLLLAESPVRERLAATLDTPSGSKTVLVDGVHPGTRVRLLSATIAKAGSEDRPTDAMPAGLDIELAREWARRYTNTAGVLRALRQALRGHLETEPDAPAHDISSEEPATPAGWARLVQGVLPGITDTPAFAAELAGAGISPTLSLGDRSGESVRELLEEATRALGDEPWGIGLLGVAPEALLREQVAASKAFQPHFAQFIGGRIDQALALDTAGISTYVPVRSTRVVRPLLKGGARRFVLELPESSEDSGRASGLAGLDTMVDTWLEAVAAERPREPIEILLLGGLRNPRCAAMLCALTQPLRAKGIEIGVMLDGAVLYTPESVSSGTVCPSYQAAASIPGPAVSIDWANGFTLTFAPTEAAEKLRDSAASEVAEAVDTDSFDRFAAQVLAPLRASAGGADGEPLLCLRGQDGWGMLEGPVPLTDLSSRVAHDPIEQLRTRSVELHPAIPGPSATPEPADVAIVGIGCLLPGAEGPREFWANILDNVNSITEIPSSRWDWRLYFDEDRQAKDKIYSRWGGFLDDMLFDPLKYGIPPKALESVDPMQLMALEVVRRTLEDAGYGDRDFDREDVSLILGASGGIGDVGAQYAVRSETVRFAGELGPEVAERLPQWTEDSFAGILLNVTAGRAANRFDFGGLNFTVDSACASSLTAVYQGVVELQAGRSSMAIVGGVDTVQGPFGYLCFSNTQALSPRGRCRTFDTTADGIVISEGIAMIALKRRADAERDGDRIYAVIKGVGGSSDGRARSMTAPHPDGQLRALRRAYQMAGYSAATVDMFEAHGTGTVAGDKAELETLTRVLEESAAAPRQSAVGSVKTLIGHTKATAGIAGLVKCALALHHRTLTPHANIETPNATFAAPECPLYLLRDPQPWVADHRHPRRASVSAFGFGGTNFHVALEEYSGDFLRSSRPAVRDDWGAELLVWRTPDRTELIRAIGQVKDAVERGDNLRVADLAYTLVQEAAVSGEAAALVVGDPSSLPQRLAAFIAHLEDPQRPLPPGGYHAAEALLPAGKVAVLFGGQGLQYPDMFRQLAVGFDEFADVLATADEVLEDHVEHFIGRGAKLSRVIYPPARYTDEAEAAAARNLTRTEIAQPALGTVEAGLWHLLQRFGLHADMAGGHSYGEFVALYAAGVFSLPDLLRVSAARGRMMTEAAEGSDLGTMAAVQIDRQRLEEIAADIPEVVVANHNAPDQSILSGPTEAIRKAVETLQARDIKARVLPVGAAFHSAVVAPAQTALAAFIEDIEMRPPTFPVYSNTTAEPHAEDPAELRALLAEHLARPVEFVAEVEAMYEAGARVFVGAGPKVSQGVMVSQILGDRPHRVVRVDDGEGGFKGFLHGLACLFVEGVQLDFEPLFAGRSCHRLELSGPFGAAASSAPPPHAWLLNGSGARPAHQPAAEPLTLEEVASRQSSKVVALHNPPAVTAVSPRPTLLKDQEQPKEVPYMPDIAPSPELDLVEEVEPTGPDPAFRSQSEFALADYQDTMRQFLCAQESVMLAYLRGGSGAGARRSTLTYRALPPRRAGSVPSRLVPPAVETEQPVAVGAVPAAGPHPVTAAPAAPAGLVPVDAPAALVAAAVDPTSAPPQLKPVDDTPPQADAPGGSKDTAELLLGIVEDRTGYPRDMLDTEQGMEADLGIDSIKRVEIIGALLEALPPGALADPEAAATELTSQSTLQGIIDWVDEQSTGGKEAASRPFNLAGARDSGASRAPLPRHVVEARLEDVDGVELDPVHAGIYLIADDEKGLGRAVEELVSSAGGTPLRLSRSELLDEERLHARLDEIKGGAEPIRALIHLTSFGSPRLSAKASLAQWRAQTATNDKSLFRLVQRLAQPLREGGRVVGVTGLGGFFDRHGPSAGVTAQGGMVGLLKSLHREWPETLCKAVDLDPALDTTANAQHILRELRLPGGRIEVGYPGGARTIFTIQSAPVAPPTEVPLAPGAVILVTGGARGITAAITLSLAASGRRFIVVGRSPEPGPEDPGTAVLQTEAELRAHCIATARGQALKPIEIQSRVAVVLRDRAMRSALKDLRETGADVEYLSADVRDETRVATLLDDLYARYGRLDGVIHGAGIIEDRLLADKSPESWERVYDTKVDSAYLLARGLRAEMGLRFVMFFCSVAGRFGNSGQTDYAAANEQLGRLACQLYHRWQGKVKVAALSWGPWASTRFGAGMVSPATARKFADMGVELVTAESGCGFFEAELGQAPSEQVEIVAGVGPWEEHERASGALLGHSTAVRQNGTTVSWPLLAGASRIDETDGRTVLRRVVDPQHDHYLSEHLVDGLPVLPAAVALELCAEAVATLHPNWSVNEVSGLRALKGIVFESGPVELDVEVGPMANGEGAAARVDVVVRSRGVKGPPHYRATVHLDRAPLEAGDFQPILRPGRVGMTPGQAYRELLFHGPCFQLITVLSRLDDKGALAEVEPSSPAGWLSDSGGTWLFDPGLVDCAPQMALLWAEAMRSESALPNHIERIRRFGDGPLGRCRMHFMVLPDQSDSRVRADVAYVDQEQRLRLLINGLECASSAALSRLGGGWKGEIRV